MSGGTGRGIGGGQITKEAPISATTKNLPAFEERPYGGRLKLTATTQLVLMAPHMSTAAGIPANKLDKDGLRGHEGEAKEHVTFIGFADQKDGDDSRPLIYRYRNQEGSIEEMDFGPADRFYSVTDNGKAGFWHVLENRSDRPIMLAVTATPTTKNLLRS